MKIISVSAAVSLFSSIATSAQSFPETAANNTARSLRGATRALHDFIPGEDRQLTPIEERKRTVNYPHTFYGDNIWKIGDIKYVGETFSQTQNEYNAAKTLCENDPECFPQYVGAIPSGSWLGNYGYHCGDKFGAGYGAKVLSGIDYCCMIHDDVNKWRVNSDDIISTAQGICVMYSCMKAATGPWHDGGLTEGRAVFDAVEYAATKGVATCEEDGLYNGFTWEFPRLPNRYECSGNLLCESDFCHFGYCKPKFGNGRACLSDGVCQSGFCHWGTCQDKLPNGNACVSNRVCASGSCQYRFPYIQCV